MVDNADYYGYLIDNDDFDVTLHTNNDLWELLRNFYVSADRLQRALLSDNSIVMLLSALGEEVHSP